MKRRGYSQRRWWFGPRVGQFWTTFLGCGNFERHFTWRDA